MPAVRKHITPIKTAASERPMRNTKTSVKAVEVDKSSSHSLSVLPRVSSKRTDTGTSKETVEITTPKLRDLRTKRVAPSKSANQDQVVIDTAHEDSGAMTRRVSMAAVMIESNGNMNTKNVKKMQTLYLTKKEAGIIFDLLDPALRKRPSSWADVVRIMNEQEGNNRSVEGIKSYWNKEVKTLLISLFPDIKIVPGEDEDEDA